MNSASAPFQVLGGRDGVSKIVNRFYDLMESHEAYRDLRAMHAQDLTPMRASLTGFLCGWLGGDTDWFDANPDKCMMSLHARFPINAALADQWTSAMRQALVDSEVDADTATKINEAFRAMASAMVRA